MNPKSRIRYYDMQIRVYDPNTTEIIIKVKNLDQARVIANLIEDESQ